MALDLMKFMARFIEEAKEHIDRMNKGLLSLEENPEDTETLNAVFRAAHTLKGSSRMMKLTPITEVAHKLEEILDALRGGRISLSRELSEILFTGIDTLGGMIEKAESREAIPTGVQKICNLLERAAAGDFAGSEEEEPEVSTNRADKAQGAEEGASAAPPSTPPSPSASAPSPPASSPQLETAAPLNTCTPPPALQKGASSQLQPPMEHGHRATAAKAHETIRIGTEKLDGLIKLTGEMVSGQSRARRRLREIKSMESLARRSFELAAAGQNGDPASFKSDILANLQALHLKLKMLSLRVVEDTSQQAALTRELQENALSMRMLPLSTLFDSFHRNVREISKSLEKKVHFVIEGGETELDKKMIEKIGDPILHMIRNSIDHGIEKPGDRLKAGKPETGIIRLCARYEGESAVIELSDDGAGISLRKVRARAVQRKMLTVEEAESCSESDLIDLIFHPGFSTSEIITDISGRGVGMDVLRRNIVEHLKGSMRVETREGRGTTFHIRLLLTLAIMHVVLVTVSDMSFAIPSTSVQEIVKVAEDAVIDVVNKKAIRLREEIIPVVDLDRVLQLPSKSGANGNERGFLILVVPAGGGRMGLVIDALVDEEDMVIKPLPAHMQHIRFVSGVTISDGNEIINVLNIPEIVEAAKDMKFERRTGSKEKSEAEVIRILVVDDSLNTREIERSILESYGYRVTLAEDGVDAMEKARGRKFDAVVTDVEMPRMDGFSLTEILRKDEEYRDVPIILVTSRDREEDKRRGIHVGANAYIVKGAFDQSNLLETIRNLIG